MYKKLVCLALSATLMAATVTAADALPAHHGFHGGVHRGFHGGVHRGFHGGVHHGFHPGVGHAFHGFHRRYAARGYGGPRYYGGRDYYYGPGYSYDDDGGAALALGIIGMAAGAMASAAAHGARGLGYCESHFRSYNPRTGTYLGYDGRYHACR